MAENIHASTTSNNKYNDEMYPMTLVLVPIMGPPELGREEIDPEFNSRPALTLSYPPPSKEPKEAVDVLNPNETMTRHKTSQGMSSLALGRNLLTRVYDTKLSRRLATMGFKLISSENHNESTSKVKVVLRVNQATATHKLCLNGTRVILEEVDVVHGDEICLHGDKYKYQVNIIENKSNKSRSKVATPAHTLTLDEAEVTQESSIILTHNDSGASSSHSQETSSSFHSDDSDGPSHKRKRQLSSSTSSSSSSPSSTRTRKIQETARQQILEDMTCTICLEILVNTHVANPCGHVFCKSCIDRIPSVKKKRYESKSCPSCRKEITSLSWARSYDHIIWNTMLMGSVFGSDPHGEGDLREFMKRSGKKWKDLSEDERNCILRRCKRLDSGDDFVKDEVNDGTFLFCREARQSKADPVLTHNGFGHPNSTSHGNEEVTIFEAITSAAGTIEDPICL